MHNCLNISIIREILANSYIVPFVFFIDRSNIINLCSYGRNELS